MHALKISKSIETTDGGVTFDGELNADELDLVISLGLNHLLLSGALPMKVMKDSDAATMSPGTETQQ